MIDWHWHSIVSLPSNQETISFTFLIIFSVESKKQIRNKIEKATFADIDLFYFSSFIFQKKSRFHSGICNPSEKVVTVEEELNLVDIDDIGNLEDLPGFALIDEECGNFKVANVDGELTIEILTKRRSQTFYSSLLMFSLWQM